ncbi:hypothetical protein GCM10009678_31640 [Actinomadura kijaniata]
MDAPEAPTRLIELSDLTLDELALDDGAARIAARFARMDVEDSDPVRVAAFNSFIG